MDPEKPGEIVNEPVVGPTDSEVVPSAEERNEQEENMEKREQQKEITKEITSENHDNTDQTNVDEQPSTTNEGEPTKDGTKKKKKDRKKRKRAPPVLTEEDFGPLMDFTKLEGFVYDPEKGKLDDDDIKVKRRPWVIPDVRSVLYLRRLERKHNKLVHGLASVRKLTPKQILKEESR